MTLGCEFCDKTFVRESAFVKHVCERKRRWQTRDEPASRIGFQAFCKFWEMNHRSAKPRTAEDFIRSPYYLGFRKWGLYCTEIRAINPEAFIRWLLKRNTPIDRWCSDNGYTEYLIDYLAIEAVTDALARSVETSMVWAEETHMQPCDILRYGNDNRLIQMIAAGRLSPWAVYGSDTGQAWLAKLRDEQIALIWPYIDAERWNKILLDRSDDRLYTIEILTQAGW